MIDRLFRAELAVDGRNVSGWCVPFDVEATVNDGDGPYVEVFKRGAFRNVVRGCGDGAHTVRLYYLHDRGTSNDELMQWVGKTTSLREHERGLWGEFRLDDFVRNERARIVGYKIEDGQLPALSVSFVPGKTNTYERDGVLVRERLTVKLVDHIAIVPEGAYPMLEPLAVRARTRTSSVDTWRAWRNAL